MAFVCLSPSRYIDNDKGDAAAPAESKEEVQAALNELDFGGVDKLVLCLPGGGIAARGFGRCPEMAVEGCFIAVLSGSLQNYAYLVRKYCLEELSLPTTISLEAIRDYTPVRETALLCKLYERLGTGMLTKLRGKFAFCLFDSSTMKVLAARDSSGTVPLVTGETANGFVFVASGDTRPKEHTELQTILPGQYIYGWRSTPVKYANPQDKVEKSAMEAVDAAAAALKGIKIQEIPDRGLRNRRPSQEPPQQRRRANSSEPYTRDRGNVYGYNRTSPDVQSWRQPIVPCPQMAYDGGCFPQRGAYEPEYGYGDYRVPRHLMGGGQHPRVRRPSLEPNWRPNNHEGHYHRGLSPEASRPVYAGNPPPPPPHHHHHDPYGGHPQAPMGYVQEPAAAPKSGFRMKKGKRREEGVYMDAAGMPMTRH